jgi:tRNA(Ile)-lysidine synthetase-like protein
MFIGIRAYVRSHSVFTKHIEISTRREYMTLCSIQGHPLPIVDPIRLRMDAKAPPSACNVAGGGALAKASNGTAAARMEEMSLFELTTVLVVTAPAVYTTAKALSSKSSSLRVALMKKLPASWRASLLQTLESLVEQLQADADVKDSVSGVAELSKQDEERAVEFLNEEADPVSAPSVQLNGEHAADAIGVIKAGGQNSPEGVNNEAPTTASPPPRTDSDLGTVTVSTHADSSVNTETAAVTSPSEAGESSLVTIDRVQENMNNIDEVLRYWFGQYSPEEAQKRLWMAGHSTAADTERIDEEITYQFGHLLHDLFQENGLRWKEWCGQPVPIYGYRGKLAAIIILDQFSRHIIRYIDTITGTDKLHKKKKKLRNRRHHKGDGKKTDEDGTIPGPDEEEDEEESVDGASSVLSQIPRQGQMDKLAFKTAQLFMEEHSVEITSGMIAVPMLIFAMMPYRHANMLATTEYVQVQIETILVDTVSQYDKMVRRFRKATNRRMAILQDEARLTGNYSTKSGSGDDGMYVDEDILETYPFVPKAPEEFVNHNVCKTICKFLHDRGIFPIPTENAEVGIDADFVANHPTTPMIVSLSGGVDSMVVASVLASLVRAGLYKLQIMAVHIDYGNRPESSAEAAYCYGYCGDLGIEFKVRRIDEVTRGITARDEYERIAREVRYSVYRSAVEELWANVSPINTEVLVVPDISGGAASASSPASKVGVYLGHHRGDLRENVLSNAHKGCSPLDLSGMTSVSFNDGVLICRPLLSLEKKEIFEYAHQFGVPYFKDTTPHWSTRGKIRNKLLPLLEEIYGEGCMHHLSDLAVESDQCKELLQAAILGQFLTQIEYKPMGITFETNQWKDCGHFFWKFVLREALHSAGMGMFTDKSVESFRKRIVHEPVREGWLECRKDAGVYLRADGRTFVFYPVSFPWKKPQQYDIVGKVVKFGPEHAVMVGPWRCRAKIVELQEGEERSKYLEKMAVTDMESFMSGEIEYYLESPTWEVDKKGQTTFEPDPLEFAIFSKSSRPMGWKGIDAKIQEIVPVLGNSFKAVKALQDPYGAGAIHVTTYDNPGESGESAESVEPVKNPNPTVLIRVNIELQVD